jgi:hypothetical protein
MTDDPNIPGLDLEAWSRWVAYRKAIKKPIKEFSYNAMALKLSRYGADQGEVVDQSIANQYQGLFPLKDKPKPARGERREKTEAEREKERAQLSAEDEKSARGWEELVRTSYGRLLLADALLARYQINRDENYADKIEHLRDKVGELIRETDPVLAAGDPRISSMVGVLFGERGFRKLKDRAKEVTSNG